MVDLVKLVDDEIRSHFEKKVPCDLVKIVRSYAKERQDIQILSQLATDLHAAYQQKYNAIGREYVRSKSLLENSGMVVNGLVGGIAGYMGYRFGIHLEITGPSVGLFVGCVFFGGAYTVLHEAQTRNTAMGIFNFFFAVDVKQYDAQISLLRQRAYNQFGAIGRNL